MSRTLTRVVCIGSVVAAGSCGFATEPLLGIFRQAEQDGRETVTVQPGRIYSSGATGFLVACPYLPRATVEDSTGTRVRDIPDSGLQEGSNALVITYPRGKVSVQRFARSAVDFCSRGAPEPVIRAPPGAGSVQEPGGTVKQGMPLPWRRWQALPAPSAERPVRRAR